MPAAFLAAGAGILGGLFGGHPHNTAQADINPLFQKLFAQQGQYFGQANAAKTLAMNQINAGFGAAQGALKGGAYSAKQSILDNQTKTLGAIKANAIGSGMSGTGVPSNQVAQAGAMSGKSLASVDTTLGQLMSNLDIQKAEAQSGQSNKIGDLAMQEAAGFTGLGAEQGKILGNFQYQNNTAGQLGFGLGGLASLLFKGGGSGGGSSGWGDFSGGPPDTGAGVGPFG